MTSSWDAQTRQFRITIPDPAYSNPATYPLVIDPTVIDSDGSIGQSYWQVLQDNGGEFYAFWRESDSTLWMNRTAGGIWQTKVKLAGAGGIITGNSMGTGSPAVCFSRDRTRIHLVFENSTQSSRPYYSTCMSLTSWNQSSGWKQTDELTNGASQVSTDTMTEYTNCDTDSEDNFYIAYVVSLVDVKVAKRTASTKAWTVGTLPGPVAVDGIDVVVTADGFIHVVCGRGDAQVHYYKSTSKQDVSAWSAALSVIDMAAHGYRTYNANIAEHQDNLLVVTACKVLTTTMKWNYWNGTIWTQGTAGGCGSTAGLTGRTAAMDLNANSRALSRDGSKNVYFGFWNTTSQYKMVKWNGSGWDFLKAVDVGSSDAQGEPSIEKRVPTRQVSCGMLYKDLAGAGNDELVSDVFLVTPLDFSLATRVVSPVAGDGTDTDIQTAINGLPATGGKVFIKAGTYLISSPIIIGKSNVTIEGEGPNSTIVRAVSWGVSPEVTGTRSMFEGVSDTDTAQTDLSDLVIKNLQLDGNFRSSPPRRVKAAILLGRLARGGFVAYKVEDVEIVNVTIYDTGGYGIKFEGNPSSSILNERVNIHNCVLDGRAVTTEKTQSGMALGVLQYAEVRGNIVTNWSYVGIDPDGCQDLTVQGNLCYKNRGGGIYVEDGSGVLPPVRISIVDNICVDNYGDSVVGKNRNPGIGVSNGKSLNTFASSILISGNVCSGSFNDNTGSVSAGIALHGVENSIITGNLSKNNAKTNDSGYGIYLGKGYPDELDQPVPRGQPCRRLVITGNKCFDDRAPQKQVSGLYVAESVTDITLAGNDFSGNSGSDIGVPSGKSMGTRGANPMRITLSVSVPTEGQNYVDVNLPWTQADTSYIAIAVPSWDTTVRVHVTEKTTTQVKFRFGSGAPSGGGTVDVLFGR